MSIFTTNVNPYKLNLNMLPSEFAYALPFFPFIIFLDYHKKEDVHLALIWLFCFYVCSGLLVRMLCPAIIVYGIEILLLVPILLFGLVLIKRLNSKN